ncbi:MAG: glycosyltransferase family 9 protein, partial [Methylococcales bacterium]
REWVDAGIEKPYLVFLHASSKERKCWHNAEWVDAARLAQHAGYRVVLPQGNLTERVQAQALASLCSNIQVLPCMNLNGLAGLLSQAAGVIGIDTGLAHLAAALGTPATTLYFTSSPRLAGARGECQLSLTASQGSESGECLDTSMGGAPLRFLNKLDAASVWECLLEQIASARTNPDV